MENMFIADVAQCCNKITPDLSEPEPIAAEMNEFIEIIGGGIDDIDCECHEGGSGDSEHKIILCGALNRPLSASTIDSRIKKLFVKTPRLYRKNKKVGSGDVRRADNLIDDYENALIVDGAGRESIEDDYLSY